MSKLTCIHGLNQDDEFTLHEGKNIIGRAGDCQVVLFDKKCSRHHCAVIKRGQHYAIEDLASTNGTLLNGKTLKKIPKSFKLDDKIKIGKTVLVLSAKAIGGVLDQTASDAAEDLQQSQFGKLLTDAAVKVTRSHGKPQQVGVTGFFKSLLPKKK